jgi:hypothetical protein
LKQNGNCFESRDASILLMQGSGGKDSKAGFHRDGRYASGYPLAISAKSDIRIRIRIADTRGYPPQK